jgi:hypothetical protein
MRKFIDYLKFYFELNAESLRKEAYASAQKYYGTGPRKTYNLQETIAYQRAYVSARRRNHAKSRITEFYKA